MQKPMQPSVFLRGVFLSCQPSTSNCTSDRNKRHQGFICSVWRWKNKTSINDFHKEESVCLQRAQIEVNPAKKQIVKLFLKCSQRPDLSNTSFYDKLFEQVFSSSYKVLSYAFISFENVYMCQKYIKGHITIFRNAIL